MSTMTLHLPVHLVAPRPRGGWLRKLHTDERGAMMIISIFMAMLVVAMLYYVAGIGETIVYRERLQDASDSAVMAGAVNFARAMNIVSLMNVVMASVLAVAVIFSIAAKGIGIGATEALASCIASWGECSICCSALCLFGVIGDGCDAHDDARDIAEDVAEATDEAQEGVLDWVRAASIAASAEVGIRHYDSFAYTAGYGQEPPVEVDSSPKTTCKKITGGWAGLEVAGLAAVTAAAIAVEESCSDGAGFAAAGALQAAIGMRPICRREFNAIDARPRRIKDGVNMGGAEFQFRAGAWATGDVNPVTNEKHDRRVGVALWDTTPDTVADSRSLRAVSDLSVAQSEYYLAMDESNRLEWLWHMKWRARLRRFQAGGGLSLITDALNRLVIH